MPFEPKEITTEHIKKAIKKIKDNEIDLIQPTRWQVEIDGIKYPPKEVMRYAHEQLNGEKIWNYDGGEPTNKYLKNLGFHISEMGDSVQKSLIEKYKDHLKKNTLSDEINKWELLGQFKGRPDVNAADFGKEIKEVNYKNLIFHNGIAVRNHIAEAEPEKYRESFKLLFNEEIDLRERIVEFENQILNIYRSMGMPLHHHHDERSVATFLTFHDPDKYALYKSSFYQKYCKLVDIKPKKKGEKYIHYLELIDNFIEDFIERDAELLELVNGQLPPGSFPDHKHKLLAQDILYKMLDQKEQSFTAVIEELKQSMLEDDSVLKDFSFGKVVDNGFSGKKDTYVWLKDSKQIIGHVRAHYEISIRTRNGKKNFYFVDVHFEGSDNSKFRNELESLPDECEWILWRGGESIGSKEGIDPKDGDLIDKLQEQLLYLELNLGDTIREVINNKTNIIISKGPNNVNHPLNQILFGPPGTGKTYSTIETAIKIVNPSFKLENQGRDIIKKEYDRLVLDGQIVFTTFHQSMSYEDFIEGIKPITTSDNEVIYEVTDGLFKRICSKALEKKVKASNFEDTYQKLLNEISDGGNKLVLETMIHAKEFTIYKNSKNNIRFHANTEKAYEGVIRKELLEHYLKTGEALDWPSYVKAIGKYLREKYNYTQSEEVEEKKFVIIIDEINRGNVSQIFGELITLIEEDKRLGKNEALEVFLPYSKKSFGVPQNVYIIGTMNTADRSVEALDTALRRRFDFTELAPNSSLISSLGKSAPDGILNGIDLPALLDKINTRIEKLLDKDHLIGHSFFMQVDSFDKLKGAFQNKIIPLLQEYFYGDFGKIELVLGAGFVREKNTDNVRSIFAKAKYDTSILDDKPIYELVDYTKKVDYVLEIDKVPTKMDFETAIRLLY